MPSSVRIVAGIDAVDTERVNALLARHGQRFLGKVFTTAEIEYCGGRVAELAARFAGKEAISKALGTGLRGIYFREMEILSDKRGKPLVQLHGNAASRAAALGIAVLEISLTHTDTLAIASVVGLAKDPPP